MAIFKDKLSNLIGSQVPDFVLDDHPKFLQFLKTYYSFMEAAELAVTSIQTTDGIQLETQTNQQNELILDGSRIDSDRTSLDEGDKILLESSTFGKFTRGETIVGQTSNQSPHSALKSRRASLHSVQEQTLRTRLVDDVPNF